MAKIDIYQAVTDRILELLDQGTVPWRQPFQGGGYPMNLVSGKPYRGVNVFLLACTAMTQGYASPYWVTFKQAKAKGGSVRKGEKSSLVVFWKKLETRKDAKPDPDRKPGELSSDDLKSRFMLRHYRVFNTEQCDDLETPDPEVQPMERFEPIEEAERIVAAFPNPPTIEHGASHRAAYGPLTDTVTMPEAKNFTDRESYYSVLFHELTHATGHSRRLDRGLDPRPPPFGSPDYSKEELVAEMGAAFLSAVAGISPVTIEQSAAYIDGWRKKLRDDKKLIVSSAAAGQRAADHILGVSWDDASRPAANDDQPGITDQEIDRVMESSTPVKRPPPPETPAAGTLFG
jgi:antirestriction protein ArdC